MLPNISLADNIFDFESAENYAKHVVNIGESKVWRKISSLPYHSGHKNLLRLKIVDIDTTFYNSLSFGVHPGSKRLQESTN